MALSLKVLNSDATLNAFLISSTSQIVRGEDATLLLQLFQPQKNIRYIPDSGATITLDFRKSDNTVLTKTASHPFSDDRSIIQFTLSDAETPDLISQTLTIKVLEGATTTFAILQSGLQMVSTTVGC